MVDREYVRSQMDLQTDEELGLILAQRESGVWESEVYEIVESVLRGRGLSPEAVAQQARGSLAERLPPEGEPPGPDEQLVVVGHYVTDAEAEMWLGVLLQAGIEAVVPADTSPAMLAGFWDAVGEVKLCVPARDAAEARAILRGEQVPPPLPPRKDDALD